MQDKAPDEIPGVPVVRPEAASHTFPKPDRRRLDITDEERFALGPLHGKIILVTRHLGNLYQELRGLGTG